MYFPRYSLNQKHHPTYRRKGYGRAVIKKSIEHAKTHDCYRIMLLSNSKRVGAHKFYEQLGFNRNRKIGFTLRI
ncbi:MAG: L-amino acid N-acyltransferase YncA [Promethearchaeota archaeon]|nr:MAG: L-amino acid N-acyltransferase YncA [Candidatus Lokiarchaeota archaeon]